MNLQQVLSQHPEREKEFKEWLHPQLDNIEVHQANKAAMDVILFGFYKKPFNSQVGWVIAWIRPLIWSEIHENGYIKILWAIGDNEQDFCTGLNELLTILKD